MDAAVEGAVACMRERFGDPLTITDLAENAALSRFDFSRLFRQETGVSPGRFLAAVRIGEAKKLIDTTAMDFPDIAAAVGYASPESFARSFTATVGLSPGRFRRLCREQGQAPPAVVAGGGPGYGSVAGTVSLPAGHGNARVFVGAFATAVVQYPALASALVDVPSDRPSCYRLPEVPEGRWHLLAVAVAAGIGHDPQAVRTALVGGAAQAVSVADGAVTSAALRLRAAGPTDVPVLLALPRLEPPAAGAVHPGCAAAADTAAPARTRTGQAGVGQAGAGQSGVGQGSAGRGGVGQGGAGRLRVVPAAPARSGA